MGNQNARNILALRQATESLLVEIGEAGGKPLYRPLSSLAPRLPPAGCADGAADD